MAGNISAASLSVASIFAEGAEPVNNAGPCGSLWPIPAEWTPLINGFEAESFFALLPGGIPTKVSAKLLSFNALHTEEFEILLVLLMSGVNS